MTSRQVRPAPQLMRTTIHTVTAADALALRPLLQPVLDRTFASTSWGQRLRGQDVGAAVAEAAGLLAERPLEPGGVAARTGPPAPRPRRRGGRLRGQLLGAVGAAPAPWALGCRRCGGDDDGRRTWLGSTGGPMTPQVLVERYLAAFGPATVRDVQAWCGLTRLREVVDDLGPRLRRYRTEDGAELLDVLDGPLPDADAPAPVRFLAEYDNVAAVLRGPFPGRGRGRPRPPAGRTRGLDGDRAGRRVDARDVGGPSGGERHGALRPSVGAHVVRGTERPGPRGGTVAAISSRAGRVHEVRFLGG